MSAQIPLFASFLVPRYTFESIEVNYGPGGLGLFGDRLKRQPIFAKAVAPTGASRCIFLLAVVDSPAWGCAGQGRFEAKFRAEIYSRQPGYMQVDFMPYDGPRQIRDVVVCVDGSWRDMQTLLHVNLYGELFTIG
jgi:hypothetical protein